MTTWLDGVIKFFIADKSYGFINPDDGTGDVFFHQSALQGLKGAGRLFYAHPPFVLFIAAVPPYLCLCSLHLRLDYSLLWEQGQTATSVCPCNTSGASIGSRWRTGSAKLHRSSLFQQMRMVGRVRSLLLRRGATFVQLLVPQCGVIPEVRLF